MGRKTAAAGSELARGAALRASRGEKRCYSRCVFRFTVQFINPSLLDVFEYNIYILCTLDRGLMAFYETSFMIHGVPLNSKVLYTIAIRREKNNCLPS